MIYKIKDIVEYYQNLVSGGNEYYEEEIFTKLEDAMIFVIGTKGTGLKIVHSGRSMVSYAGMKGKKCELADVRILFYSLKREKCRLVFLDFKKNKQCRRLGNVIEVQEDHYNLYKMHYDVKSAMRGVYIPEDILKDKIYYFDESCTMYAIIDSDVKKDYPISFVGVEQLIRRSRIRYEYPMKSVVDIAGNTSFEYCSYIPGLEEFFEQAKDMRIGREIPFDDLFDVLGDMFEVAPDNLKGLIEMNDNRDSNYSQGASQFVNTIFLNVDELE